LEPWFPYSGEKIGEVWFEPPGNPPLLTKFLFTSENLSVQVHPVGKTEMWHILAAEPGAKIAAGFRDTMTREQLARAIAANQLEDLLCWFEASPGDTFFIPAGTVHAIGAGLTLCEIQQYSDITYRLYDYGRRRELHVEQGLAVSDLGPHAARQQARGDVLVECPFFTTRRIHVEGIAQHQPYGRGFDQLIVIEGSGAIDGKPTKAGDVWQTPPGTPAFEIRGSLALLQAFTG
jgi:mannose-6-phosphate isomerase